MLNNFFFAKHYIHNLDAKSPNGVTFTMIYAQKYFTMTNCVSRHDDKKEICIQLTQRPLSPQISPCWKTCHLFS